jgi:hypothetical protein
MKFISIGPYCACADIIMQILNPLYNNITPQEWFIRTAYPFDYIFSSLEMIKHCINDRFNIFLDKKYYKYSSETRVRYTPGF